MNAIAAKASIIGVVLIAALVGLAAWASGDGGRASRPGAGTPTLGAPAAASQPEGAARGRASLAGWGPAEEVPGTATLNQGRDAAIASVSCASAGNCTAGGSYRDGFDYQQAFVTSETSGTWQPAQQAPGTAALNQGGGAAIASLSCASAGNCSAGGSYRDGSGHQQAFVTSETSGTWQPAQEAPGTAGLNRGGTAYVESVSCASAGNCSAGGSYTDSSGHQQAFVASENQGTWQPAQEAPGTAGLNRGGTAYIESVSCASAGNCSAGGSYTDSSGHQQAFVASETSGTWQPAQEAPGTAVLNHGGAAVIESVSCPSAGTCSAGGDYLDGSSAQAFVVSEAGGRWQQAEEVPGTAVLNQGAAAVTESVSCATAGNCTAAGDYLDGSSAQQVFVVSEAGGRWQQAEQIPGTAVLNTGRKAGINSLSCASADNCSAGGSYASGPTDTHAFVVGESNHRWQPAEETPGAAVLDTGQRGVVYSVSCATGGYCSAGGQYDGGPSTFQAFVVSKTPPSNNRLDNLGLWDAPGGTWGSSSGPAANG